MTPPVGTDGSQKRQKSLGEPRPLLRGLVVLMFLAFGCRYWNVVATSTLPSTRHPIGDAFGYLDWSAQILETGWWGDETFYQAPLYPYFLAAIRGGLGLQIEGIRVLQAVIGAISVGLLGWSCRSLGTATAWIAAAMLAFYPPAIFYDGLIQKACLASFLTTSLLALLSLADERPRFSVLLAAGAVLGLLTLTRENALVWGPILMLWVGAVIGNGEMS